MLATMGVPLLAYGQTKAKLLPSCPECAFAGQAVEPQSSGPPQVVYLQNPKPFDFGKIPGSARPDLRIELIGRVVSSRPLILDVLDADAVGQRAFLEACGFIIPVALADARLRGILSRLQFNQVVKATLFYGGNAEFPHEFVLSELALNAPLNTRAGSCPSQSGLLISYRGGRGSIRVFNDGTVVYEDLLADRFNHKISREDIGQLLKSFDDAKFDSISSSSPLVDSGSNWNRLTLICSRLQSISVQGLESRLVPLISRLENLEQRTTSQALYLLLIKDRVKLTIREWPFPQLPLRDLRIGHPTDRGQFANLLPQAFLAQVPEGTINNYFTDAGNLYRVERARCDNRPHCDHFEDLYSHEIRPAETLVAESHEDPYHPIGGTVLAVVQPIWPGNVEARLSEVPKEGLRVSQAEYEKHLLLYFQLLKAGTYNGLGVDLIEDGYLYQGVRICHVDPQAPPTRCLKPDGKNQ